MEQGMSNAEVIVRSSLSLFYILHSLAFDDSYRIHFNGFFR